MVNIPHILKYLYPSAVPTKDYTLTLRGGEYLIMGWNTALLGNVPSMAYLAEVEASIGYQRWLAENGGSPTLTTRREALDLVSEFSALPAAIRGGLIMLAMRINGLIMAYNIDRVARGLTPYALPTILQEPGSPITLESGKADSATIVKAGLADG